MNRKCIVTYAAGAHEELLDVTMPSYLGFGHRHGYDVKVGDKMTDWPPAWNKVPILLDLLGVGKYDEVVWFDCDLVVVDPTEDFPPLAEEKSHALVRHFEDSSEVPNSGVWRLRPSAIPLLQKMQELEVFYDHGWWEQAALMTLMGYTVPPQGSPFEDTQCRCVRKTRWYQECQFMRLIWNSHPEYRADKPRVVHCSYPKMVQRLQVMRELMRDPHYGYPRIKEKKEEVKG